MIAYAPLTTHRLAGAPPLPPQPPPPSAPYPYSYSCLYSCPASSVSATAGRAINAGREPLPPDVKLSHDDDLVKTKDGGLAFSPYNPSNVEITLNDVQSILARYGLPPVVRNLEIFRRAFVHTSYLRRPQYENLAQHITLVERPDNCLPLKTKSNERLEFMGDGILEAITKIYLYRRFPKADEEFMSDKKVCLVKNDAIGKLALEMGLHRWWIISKHAEEKKIRTNVKRLGGLFEAFLGAVYCNFEPTDLAAADARDADESPAFKMAQRYITRIFETHVDWVSVITTNDNYKHILQIKIQKEFKLTPHYLELRHTAERGYCMGVYLCLGQPIHGVRARDAFHFSQFGSFAAIREYVRNHHRVLVFLGEGEHKIKGKAEQMACHVALGLLPPQAVE